MEVESALVPPPLQYHVVGRSDGLVGTGLMHLAACSSATSRKKVDLVVACKEEVPHF